MNTLFNLKITRSLFFLVMITYGIDGYGQELYRIAPPTPETASLLQYGNIPVSAYTGIPNINVPIYTIQFRDLTVPISLSYHASGIRVADESSWVGLGWVLNAGGVIGRQIMGESDFESTYFNSGIHVEDLISFPEGSDAPYGEAPWEDVGIMYNPACQVNLLGGTLDLSQGGQGQVWDFTKLQRDEDDSYLLSNLPDQFTYNFLGYSGKFVFDPTKETYFSQQEKISFEASEDGNSFTVKTSNGNTFIFDKTEHSGYLYEAFEGPNAWYLSKIISPNDNEIDFNYSYLPGPKPINVIAQILNWVAPGYIDVNVPRWASTQNPNLQENFNTPVLQSITYENGRVDFISFADRLDLEDGRRLSQIKIYTKDTQGSDHLFRTFTLNNNGKYFDYPGRDFQPLPNEDLDPNLLYKRLKLLGLKEEADGDISEYEFEYYEDGTDILPGKTSFAKDYWGYYNGKFNQSLIPRYSGYIRIGGLRYLDLEGAPGFPWANREPDPAYTKAFSLKSITYPTGGKTTFEYENHTFDKLKSEENDFELKAIREELITGPNPTFNLVNKQGYPLGDQIDLRMMQLEPISGLGNLIVKTWIRSEGLGCSAILERVEDKPYSLLFKLYQGATPTFHAYQWDDQLTHLSNNVCYIEKSLPVSRGVYSIQSFFSDEEIEGFGQIVEIETRYEWENNIPCPEGSLTYPATKVDGFHSGIPDVPFTKEMDLTNLFIDPQTGTGALSGTVHLRCESGTCLNLDNHFYLKILDGQGNVVYTFDPNNYNPDAGGEACEDDCWRSFRTELPAGSYTWEAWFEHYPGSFGETGGIDRLQVDYSWAEPRCENEEIEDQPFEIAGGLRVAKITDNGEEPNSPPMVRKFEYHGDIGAESEFSFGRRMRKPRMGNEFMSFDRECVVISPGGESGIVRFRNGIVKAQSKSAAIYYDYIFIEPEPHEGIESCLYEFKTGLAQTGASVYGLGPGAGGTIVGYDQVSILYGEEGGNYGSGGITVLEYENESDLIFDYEGYKPPSGFSSLPYNRNGLLKKQTDYKNDRTSKVRTIENTYQSSTQRRMVYGLEFSFLPTYQFTGDFLSHNCTGSGSWGFLHPLMISENIRLGSTSEVIFGTDGSQQNITTHYNYEPFGEEKHFQLSSQSTVNSEGKTYATHYYYPEDFSGVNTGPIKLRRDKHIHSTPIETIQTVNGQAVGGVFQTYQSNGVLPEKVYSLATDAPINNPHNPGSDQPGTDYEARVSFDQYDAHGNLLEQHLIADGGTAGSNTHTVYVWGHNKTRPVAKLVGPGLSTVNVAGLDETNVAGLQDQFPDAFVTTYTYNDRLQVETITDPNGLTTTYTYDGLGRLIAVTDHNGQPVQSVEYNYESQP